MAYRKLTKRRFDLQWDVDDDAIAYDRRSDGMDPLMTNDRTLSDAQVFEAHKGQPLIEKRFDQINAVYEIAPVFLKDEGRTEALFTLYTIALLIQALIERELRRAMARDGIAELPIYPEQRQCSHPTTEQVLRLFSLAERHQLRQHGTHRATMRPGAYRLAAPVARTSRGRPGQRLLDSRATPRKLRANASADLRKVSHGPA